VYLARCVLQTPDGPQLRILASADPSQGWADVRASAAASLRSAGATAEAAARIAAATIPGSMTAALAAGPAFLDAARAAAAGVAGLAPVRPERLACPVDPPSYRDYMSFEDHFSFGYRRRGVPVPGVLYELPVGYAGNPHSFVGPDEEIGWPHYAADMDYELELGIVIGAGGRDVRPENARQHIVGLTILNDFSARDIQFREMAGSLGPCKGKHFGSAVGPWITTLDEIDPAALSMTARINGETRCESSTSQMTWSIEELVAWSTAAEYLPAGSLLGSGTANGGSGLEYGRYLAPGDVTELEIQGLGVLRNQLGERGTGWMPDPHRPAAKS
jgi:2-keto-4-pentenoate hydratase/2-oxohepta-3-ene-1,7-dioic acid hydratase in catechol pathway